MTPLFPDVGIIGLVPDYWGLSVWQPRHHVLTRLSRYFQVLWVDPALGWRDFWLPGKPQPKGDLNGMAKPPGFSVYPSTRWTPGVFRPEFAASALRRLRLHEARQRLKRLGCKKIILYIWRPEFRHALDEVDADVVCYHIDDEYTFSDSDLAIPPEELDLLIQSDCVIVHSRELANKKGFLNPNMSLVPNGVDFEMYSAAHPEPDDMKNIPHPRAGYVGVIKKQLDLQLLLDLAGRHSELSFVCVGPYGQLGDGVPLVDAMKRLPNVHFLGRKPIAQLPAYMRHLDVCLLPYVRNDYTRYIFPMKLHEYLATGRPVIGTPIASLQEFGQVIQLATSREEWSAALARATSPEAMAAPRVRERKALAREYDWNLLVANIASGLCSHLGATYDLPRADCQAVQSAMSLHV